MSLPPHPVRRALAAMAMLVCLAAPHSRVLLGRADGHRCGCSPSACWCDLAKARGKAPSHCDGMGDGAALRSCPLAPEAPVSSIAARDLVAIPRPPAPPAAPDLSGRVAEAPLSALSIPLPPPSPPPPRAVRAA